MPLSRRFWRMCRDAAEILALTVAGALAVKTFALDAVRIPSGSMEHTLVAGDFVLVNKFTYGPCTPRYMPLSGEALPVLRFPGPGAPRRGDVIVFYAPGVQPPRLYIKRVAALPGDTVMIRGGTLTVNGRPVARPASANAGGTPVPDFGPVCVPAGGAPSYFVLGDNLGDSADSRAWGLVPFESIVGRAFLIYWSVDAQGHVRRDRLGRFIH